MGVPKDGLQNFFTMAIHQAQLRYFQHSFSNEGWEIVERNAVSINSFALLVRKKGTENSGIITIGPISTSTTITGIVASVFL